MLSFVFHVVVVERSACKLSWDTILETLSMLLPMLVTR